MTWLLTLEARDADNAPTTLRFADGAYHAPMPVLYLPRIRQPGLYREGLFAGELVSVARSGVGETLLINTDRALDGLADYAVDGRTAVLARVDEQGAVVEVFRGTAEGLAFGDGEVSVRLREPQAALQVAHPHQSYAGDNALPNGLEGTPEDIAGQPKPRVYGAVLEASPVLVNSSRLIYQVSSRADCLITGCYDRGAMLTRAADYPDLAALQSTAPSPGQYRCYQGYVRLGASPAGVVTVDATTSATGAGSVMAAIADEAGYALAPADVAALDAVGSVGLYLTEADTTAALLDRLAVSVGGYWRVQPDGHLRAHLLVAPGTPTQALDDHQIETLTRSATGAGANGLPVWRVTVRADRIETVQTDLAGNVTDARRARLGNDYRDAIAERPATRDRHPLADDLTLESDLRSLTAAQAVAERIADLLSVRRDRLELDARLAQTQTLRIGDSVRLRTPRLGYTEGRPVLVIGRELNARTGRITLQLWG